MNIQQDDEGRERWRRISDDQLTAAERVLQHWFARVAPAFDVSEPTATPSAGPRAENAGGDRLRPAGDNPPAVSTQP